MAEQIMKNRTRFTSSLDNGLLAEFDELAAIMRIPKSRLLDEAVRDLIRKHVETVKHLKSIK